MKQPGAALIALALCLVCLAPSARAGKNTGMSSTKVEATATAGNQQEAIRGAAGTHKAAPAKQETAPRNPDTIIRAITNLRPHSVICVFPAGTAARAGSEQPNPRERRIKVAPGHNPLTVCPRGSKAFPYYGHVQPTAGIAEKRTPAETRPSKQQAAIRAPREGANPEDLSRQAGQAEEGNLQQAPRWEAATPTERNQERPAKKNHAEKNPATTPDKSAPP